ncbi:serologically defined colon cancer antigen 8 homolog isoform X2 [Anastrepha ludens]|uniref:serologically defined colon cancer antigen 8 homolog isoform X2 n=1 Tax=Anastrepha ludens TaxID=28586 RepID=UPI0023B0E35A|nr:serologically defined colon cancer antigen 8 homolog isoform X2 [Anastrepha ludens]
MKSSKSAGNRKCKPMDYTNYAYNEAVSRLKLMLAESYAPPRGGGAGGSGVSGAYTRHGNEDSTDNYSDNLSVIERPVYSDISKYLSPAQKSRLSPGFRTKPKPYNTFSSSKENLTLQMPYAGSTTTTTAPLDYYTPSKPQQPATDSVHAPVEIFNFIEKQEDYIEQLEKESKYCRNELSNLLGKVKDVINENTHLTETARSELAALSGAEKAIPTTSPSSDSDEQQHYKKKSATTQRCKKDAPPTVKSPRYAAAPNIVYEARISELEAELMQSNIDLKRFKTENEELKRKLAHVDPLVLAGTHTATPATNSSGTNCEAHRRQIDHLQQEKNALEENVRQLQKLLDEAKSQQFQSVSSKRYINDLVQMERAQAELEVKHLREELDRQHERVRELQHEMARRIADERANAERRYNTQVDQLGGDLSSQWEQVAKLQLDLEREKRYANDIKRDLSNRNAQIEELKMELRSNRNTFLAEMAQVNAEKQSLEQEITSLRLQLDRAAREAKTEATRLTAEITSLRQRLDRGDADLLHSKREVLRLNDEIANLEKELTYGEMKNEIRPTKKDLDKRISEMQEKHAETVNELEDMIQSQKQLMDKLTGECKALTSKLEDTTLKHKTEISTLQSNVEYLSNRMLNSERIGKLDSTPISYSNPPGGKATLDYKPSTFGTAEPTRTTVDDYTKSAPYTYESILGKSGAPDTFGSTATTSTINNTTPAITTASSLYNKPAYEQPTISSDKNDDYKSSYNNKYGLNDPDDENIKDNLGEGEKRRTNNDIIGSGGSTSAAIPSSDTTRTDYDYTKDYSKDYDKDYSKDYSKEYTTGDINTSGGGTDLSRSGTDPNVAAPIASTGNDYNTDYSGYEGYGQQQYDASAYDVNAYDQSAYDGSQQQYGTAGQYDTDTQSGYDTSGGQGGYGDYSATDYDQSAYQYEGTPAVAATGESTTTSAASESIKSPPPTVDNSGAGDFNATPTTQAPSTPGSITSPSTAPAVTSPAGRVATNVAGRTATESRNQPRASSGVVGSGGAGSSGSVGGGKSNLSQQSAASAPKK